LCARLVGDAIGLPVVKVESARRPDGARRGSPDFWERLNAGKEEVALDLDDERGRRRLREAVDGAAVVVSASRPRAFAHLGVDPVEIAARGVVWVSITGYGWFGPGHDRVAFGDDAAVAGGAAVAAGGPESPVFVLDAVADPLSGLAAANAAVDAWGAGGGAFVDVCMAGVVAAALRG
jgi:crotonobetainyl-CoA:carnitine CoA-transferase CaiB-like acyl-CoA transferase